MALALRMIGTRLALAVALAAAASPRARASDLDEFGFGPRAIAMGGAYSALATDWTAPYYNPAGVAVPRSLGLGFGYSYGDYAFKYKSQAADRGVDRRAERVDPLSAVSAGFVTSLGERGTLLGRVGVGFAMFVPTRHALSVDWETAPAEPQFWLYGKRENRMTMMPALALRLPLPGDLEETQTLAIGVGGNVLVNISGQQTFSLGTSSASQVKTGIDATYDLAPNVGLFYWPLDWLSFGVAYRGELSLGAKVNVVIDLTGNGQAAFPLDLEAISFFQPQEIQGGFAVDPVDWLTVSFDLTWKNWSAFKDPFLTVGTVIGQVDPKFKDTISPKLGLELDVTDALALRLGYFFEPSPIPPQRGPTNMVDLDKHVLSFGVGYTHSAERPKPAAGGAPAATEPYRPLSVDVFFQWHHLVGERVTKSDPANSGGAGAQYEASGEIFNVGIALTIRL